MRLYHRASEARLDQRTGLRIFLLLALDRGCGARTCLQAVYNNPKASEANRVKAASAAIGFEMRKPEPERVIRLLILMTCCLCRSFMRRGWSGAISC